MTEIELAWLAGLLEGEGWFGIDRTGKGRPAIKVNMTDQDVIERVADLLGGIKVGIQPAQGNWKTQYVVRLKGERAASLMRTLQPLMGARRAERIREVLAEVDAGTIIACGRGKYPRAS